MNNTNRYRRKIVRKKIRQKRIIFVRLMRVTGVEKNHPECDRTPAFVITLDEDNSYDEDYVKKYCRLAFARSLSETFG